MKGKAIGCGVAILALALAVPATAGDWALPLGVVAPGGRTDVTIGLAASATDGYDQGLDVPAPVTGAGVNAVFQHPDWQVLVSGSPVTGFHRDIRGTLPQEFEFEVTSSAQPVTVAWERPALPPKLRLEVREAGGDWVDMRGVGLLQSQSPLSPVQFTVRVAAGDTQAPTAPGGLAAQARGTSVYLSWPENVEEDLEGYRIHWGDAAGAYRRAVDLKKVNNYTLTGIEAGVPRYVALTAYDTAGNEGPLSPELAYLAPNAKAYVVSGTVTDAGTGRRLKGIQMTLRRTGETLQASTDSLGRFRITGVAPGGWTLSGRSARRLVRARTVQVGAVNLRLFLRAQRR